MRGVNKVILLGNLGRDPEIRYSATGAAIANVTLATSEQWKDKTTGERREATEWHRVVFFGRLAEVVGQYLGKGAPIYVEGKLQTRKWQDRDGNERYTTEIVAHEMQMLGGGENSSGDRRGKTPGNTRGPARSDENSPDDFDDDIPF